MNLIGIDFEDWYHPELVKKFVKDKKHEPIMFKGLDKIIELLRKNDTQATFFVVGELIKKNPRKRFLANINPKNKNLISFFKKNDFKLIQYTFEKIK